VLRAAGTLRSRRRRGSPSSWAVDPLRETVAAAHVRRSLWGPASPCHTCLNACVRTVVALLRTSEAVARAPAGTRASFCEQEAVPPTRHAPAVRAAAALASEPTPPAARGGHVDRVEHGLQERERSYASVWTTTRLRTSGYTRRAPRGAPQKKKGSDGARAGFLALGLTTSDSRCARTLCEGCQVLRTKCTRNRPRLDGHVEKYWRIPRATRTIPTPKGTEGAARNVQFRARRFHGFAPIETKRQVPHRLAHTLVGQARPHSAGVIDCVEDCREATSAPSRVRSHEDKLADPSRVFSLVRQPRSSLGKSSDRRPHNRGKVCVSRNGVDARRVSGRTLASQYGAAAHSSAARCQWAALSMTSTRNAECRIERLVGHECVYREPLLRITPCPPGFPYAAIMMTGNPEPVEPRIARRARSRTDLEKGRRRRRRRETHVALQGSTAVDRIGSPRERRSPFAPVALLMALCIAGSVFHDETQRVSHSPIGLFREDHLDDPPGWSLQIPLQHAGFRANRADGRAQ